MFNVHSIFDKHIFKACKMVHHLTLPDQCRYCAHCRDDRVNSRSSPTACPLCPLVLYPCDFWLWRFLEDRVYGGSIRTLSELKASITSHVAAIDREILRTTVEHAINMSLRIEHVLDSNGMDIEHML
ncbi:hypothetical protein AVEN_39009-1 [Araneus ventricosus]|uniref:Uncharacterized protein n=1 Tax=Araneus ventricosus TaxID=182803 RepID=A0A4Y2DN47_ARAVE|nr:hypothetical protein AVEN_39009-1 [Araneus ventricosus]